MLEIIRMSADRIPLHCLAISISRVGKARTNPLLRSGTPDRRDSVNVAFPSIALLLVDPCAFTGMLISDALPAT